MSIQQAVLDGQAGRSCRSRSREVKDEGLWTSHRKAEHAASLQLQSTGTYSVAVPMAALTKTGRVLVKAKLGCSLIELACRIVSKPTRLCMAAHHGWLDVSVMSGRSAAGRAVCVCSDDVLSCPQKTSFPIGVAICPLAAIGMLAVIKLFILSPKPFSLSKDSSPSASQAYFLETVAPSALMLLGARDCCRKSHRSLFVAQNILGKRGISRLKRNAGSRISMNFDWLLIQKLTISTTFVCKPLSAE
jgi:hypothetical protein